ncbi:MAG: flippase-like domain-containing protein [Deltaproteobacteria bacterium]|nr:flippase-like domain-containing protein [Deltaproteobacteria bacterium]MBN2673106.1 flippase-like domain-containing protein [Deltaproteobacteria bacterium]
MNNTAAASKRRFSSKKIVIATLGVVLSVGGLAYAFHGVKVSQLMDSLNRIQWGPLLMSLAAYWGGVVIARAFLVRYMMKRFGDVSWIRAYRCLGIGFLANNILPFRIGDLARSASLAKGASLSFSTVVGGLALERLLDMAMVALVGFMALQVAPLPDMVRSFITYSAIGVAVLGAVILIFISRFNDKQAFLGEGPLGKLIWTLWQKFSGGFTALQSFRGVLWVIFLEVLIWGFVLLSFSTKLAAFGLPCGVEHTLLLTTCLGAAVALPSAPGYVGVYHAAATIVVSNMAGVEHSVAVAFALFSWVVDIASGNIAGMFGMIFEGMTFGDLKRVGTLENGSDD